MDMHGRTWFSCRVSARKSSALLRLECLEDRLALSPVAVADSTAYPWRSVVRIEAHFPNEPRNVFTEATGTLIDSFHVLTAGHVLYDSNAGGWADQVRIYPAENEVDRPFGGAYATTARVFENFIHNDQAGVYDEHSDLGLLTLDRTIGNTTGWASIGYHNDTDYYTNLDVNTAGYPAEEGYSGYGLYHQFGPLQGVSGDGQLLSWDYSSITAIAGQSGSPLYIYNPTTGERTVYGVLVAGDDATQTGYGVRLTESIYEDLLLWQTEDVTPGSTPASRMPPVLVGQQVADPDGFESGVLSGATSSLAVGTDLGPAAASMGIGAFDPSTGNWYLRDQVSSGAANVGVFQFGAPGWIPVVGDWNGDGTTTIGVFDPSTATFYLRDSNNIGGALAGIIQFGAPGWIPVVGDWNGDGTTTIGVFDPSTATFYLRNSNSQGAPDAGNFSYGGPGWKPLAGDWNADGTTTVGVFDPSTASWYLRNSNSQGAPDAGLFTYGLANWQPVTFQTNGAATSIGVIDPSTLTWYVRNSASGGAPTTTPFTYGVSDWVGLGGQWRTASDRPASAKGMLRADDGSFLNGLLAAPEGSPSSLQAYSQSLGEDQDTGEVFADVRRQNESWMRKHQMDGMLADLLSRYQDDQEHLEDKMFGYVA